MTAQNIVLIVHYYPPINSSGAKRMDAMSKYFAREGRNVTVITTSKSGTDGDFSETFPKGVEVIELDHLGRARASFATSQHRPPATDGTRTFTRRVKDQVMNWFGQLPDPRLPFALSFARPRLAEPIRKALQEADIVVATTPPWPPLLAALLAKWRFKKPIVLDYRDQFSCCHEMPGGAFAKALEIPVDRFLARRANALVAISPPMAEYYVDFNPKTGIILNGYEPEYLAMAKQKSPWKRRQPDAPLIIRYLGLVSEGRIPRALLSAMASKVASGQIKKGSIKFEYYGDVGLLQRYLQTTQPDLLPFFSFHPQVSYSRSLELAVTADHLLFCENAIPPKPGEGKSAQGILTTKLFEYLASGRPVLAHISSKALAGSFIVKANAQHFISESQADFEAFFSSDEFWNPQPVAETPFVLTLSRASQAADYLKLLDAVVSDLPIPAHLKVAKDL